jgi:hypothetical protein
MPTNGKTCRRPSRCTEPRPVRGRDGLEFYARAPGDGHHRERPARLWRRTSERAVSRRVEGRREKEDARVNGRAGVESLALVGRAFFRAVWQEIVPAKDQSPIQQQLASVMAVWTNN